MRSGRKVLKSAVTDQAMIFWLLFLLSIYMAVYAYFRFFQIASIPLNYQALVVLIPIFFTDSLKTLWESFGRHKALEPQENLQKVTVVIPTHNGEDTLGETIGSLLKRFPPHRIVIASNGSTDRSIEISRELGVRVVEIKKAIGKVAAINVAMSKVRTKYTLIMDDDTILGDAVVPTNVLDAGYQGAAFRVLPVLEGWLSVLQMYEYRKSMDIGRGFHNAAGTVLTISGAIGLFHTHELVRQISLHSGEFSGEDLQRTLLIHMSGSGKGVVFVDSTVTTHVPIKLFELFRQRVLGWNPGFLSNLQKYVTLAVGKNVPFRLRYEAFFSSVGVVLLDPLRLVSLPVLLFSPTYLFLFYVTYILIELVPYFALGRQEPFWVVLVSPIYGLFNCIARFFSVAVFLYRRLSYKLGKAEFYDHYKFVGFTPQAASLFLTVLLFLMWMNLWTFLFVVPDSYRQHVEDQIEEEWAELRGAP